MRKLAKALYHVGRGGTFDSSKLFDTRRLQVVTWQSSSAEGKAKPIDVERTDFRGVTFSCSVSLPCARAPSVSRHPEDL